MIWLAVAAILISLFVMGNIRVWKTERIRTNCLEQAVIHRADVIGDNDRSIIARAAIFETYVRNGKPEEKQVPPPPPPPPRRA